MAHPKVSLTLQRRATVHEIEDALAEAGAAGIRTEIGCGNSEAGVSAYFIVHFADPDGPVPTRAVQGFFALTSPEHPEGWTDLRMGSDERGRHFVASAAEALGASGTFDEATGYPVEAPHAVPRPR